MLLLLLLLLSYTCSIIANKHLTRFRRSGYSGFCNFHHRDRPIVRRRCCRTEIITRKQCPTLSYSALEGFVSFCFYPFENNGRVNAVSVLNYSKYFRVYKNVSERVCSFQPRAVVVMAAATATPSDGVIIHGRRRRRF